VVESRRKKGESFEVFLRKFNKRLQQSGKLLEVRQRQFLSPKLNKTAQKRRALVGRKIRAEKEYLRKTGKLVEEPKRRW
jgi:ribosomal protein S21